VQAVLYASGECDWTYGVLCHAPMCGLGPLCGRRIEPFPPIHG